MNKRFSNLRVACSIRQSRRAAEVRRDCVQTSGRMETLALSDRSTRQQANFLRLFLPKKPQVALTTQADGALD